jgi:hypothetical protein
MSLFSAVILPHLEKELIGMTPQIADVVIRLAHSIGTDVIAWAQNKIESKEKEQKGEGDG